MSSPPDFGWGEELDFRLTCNLMFNLQNLKLLGWGQAMDLKRVAKDTAKVLMSYMTYQALRTVLDQLGETDPPQALWLHSFSANQGVQDGEAFLQALLRERQELAFRIMTVRQHLAEEVLGFMPEMVQTNIQKSNMENRRQYLERMTRLSISEPTANPERQTDSDA